MYVNRSNAFLASRVFDPGQLLGSMANRLRRLGREQWNFQPMAGV